MNGGHDWDVVVQDWSVWCVFGDITDVLEQVFFDNWSVEEVWQHQYPIDVQFLGVFGQFVHIGDIGASDVQQHFQLMLAGDAEPFFGQAFTFIKTQSHAFAGESIDHNAMHALLLQVGSVLVDGIKVNRAFPIGGRNGKLLTFGRVILIGRR